MEGLKSFDFKDERAQRVRASKSGKKCDEREKGEEETEIFDGIIN